MALYHNHSANAALAWQDEVRLLGRRSRLRHAGPLAAADGRFPRLVPAEDHDAEDPGRWVDDSERELTDENLRVEREKADDALARASVDEIADAVLWKARSAPTRSWRRHARGPIGTSSGPTPERRSGSRQRERWRIKSSARNGRTRTKP